MKIKGEIRMREQVIERIEKEKLIAIVRGVSADQCSKVANALYAGGVRLMEITYNQKDPASWQQTAEAIGALTEEFGDAVQFDEQNAQGDSNTCSTIITDFVSDGVDLILANATPALQAASAGTADIPILGTAVTEYGVALDLDDFDGTVGTNISGTSDLAPLDQQAAMLNELFPDAKNVGLVYCSAEANSQYQVDTVKAALEELGYSCEYYAFSDSNDLSTIATKAASESDVLYAPTDNTAASNTEIINNICLPAKVPVIAGEENMCSAGGLATLSISYESIGYNAGLMAYDILVNGKNPADMPIQYADDVTLKYNADIASELGIEIPDDMVAIEKEDK